MPSNASAQIRAPNSKCASAIFVSCIVEDKEVILLIIGRKVGIPGVGREIKGQSASALLGFARCLIPQGKPVPSSHSLLELRDAT